MSSNSRLRISAEPVDDNEIPDRRLGLMFACAHPAIDAAIRAPLMLQAVLGLDAAQIASAFLMSPSAMGQRLVRAKTKIRQARIPLRIPDREELPERLETILDAIYAAFAEGWTDAAGADVARRDLSEEAIYLGRLVTQLLPGEPEALGLLALMLYAEARRPRAAMPPENLFPSPSRTLRSGIAHGSRKPNQPCCGPCELSLIGRYQLEAAIQSAHISRRRDGIENWPGYRKALRRSLCAHRLSSCGHQSRGCHRRRSMAPALPLPPSMRSAPTPASWTISPTGRPVRRCWRVPARNSPQQTPTKSRSVSSATPRCGNTSNASEPH